MKNKDKTNCPNCGAPITKFYSHNCPYCSTYINLEVGSDGYNRFQNYELTDIKIELIRNMQEFGFILNIRAVAMPKGSRLYGEYSSNDFCTIKDDVEPITFQMKIDTDLYLKARGSIEDLSIFRDDVILHLPPVLANNDKFRWHLDKFIEQYYYERR